MQTRSISKSTSVAMVSLIDCCDMSPKFFGTVTNANHAKVVTVLEKIMRGGRHEICQCQRCVNDIIALALNYLPPHYYVDAGRGGDIGSPSVMVENAVIEAMDTVGKNPRH